MQAWEGPGNKIRLDLGGYGKAAQRQVVAMNLLPVLTNRAPEADICSGYTWVYDTIPLQLEMVWVVTVHSFYREWGPGPVLHSLRPGTWWPS